MLSVVVSIHCVDDGMKPTNNDNFLQMAKDAVRASAGKRKAEKEAEASAAVDTNDRTLKMSALVCIVNV
jgi:hypothetical protein